MNSSFAHPKEHGSEKISFYPMPDVTFLKISGAKLEIIIYPTTIKDNRKRL